MLGGELFRALPAPELRRLVSIAEQRRFSRNEVVFHRGDPADTLHLIVRGRFAARMVTRVGDTVTVSVHGPGDASASWRSWTSSRPDRRRSPHWSREQPMRCAGRTSPACGSSTGGQRSARPPARRSGQTDERASRRGALRRCGDPGVAPPRRARRSVRRGSTRHGHPTLAERNRRSGRYVEGNNQSRPRAEAKRGTVELLRGQTIVVDPVGLAKRAKEPGHTCYRWWHRVVGRETLVRCVASYVRRPTSTGRRSSVANEQAE